MQCSLQSWKMPREFKQLAHDWRTAACVNSQLKAIQIMIALRLILQDLRHARRGHTICLAGSNPTAPVASPPHWVLWYGRTGASAVGRGHARLHASAVSATRCGPALARQATAERPARPVFAPWLHAGAGHLTSAAEQAWRDRPGFGTRFAELVAALRRAPRVSPATLLRLLRAAAGCEDDEVGALAAEADGLEPAAAQLSALPPDAPLPVSAAVLVCMAPDGYLTAPSLRLARGRPRRSRRRRHASHLSGDACPTDIDSDVAVPTRPPLATSTSDAAWEALDEVDLREELRHPTPNLQDVPPFMRAAVRNALTSALARLRAAHAAGHSTGPGASRAWKLFSPRACCWRGRSNMARKAGHCSSSGQQRSSATSGRSSSLLRVPGYALPSRPWNSTQLLSSNASANGHAPKSDRASLPVPGRYSRQPSSLRDQRPRGSRSPTSRSARPRRGLRCPRSCSSTSPSALSSSQHVPSPARSARPDGVGRLACPA